MFRARRPRRARRRRLVAVKTLPRALFKAPLGEPGHSTTDGKGRPRRKTNERREEEARKPTWRCGPNERTSGRASDRLGESSGRFPREKRYPGFSPSTVAARDSRLPRQRDRRDRQLSVRNQTFRGAVRKDRAKSERCYRSSRSFSSALPLRPSSPPLTPSPRPLVASRARIEAARRDPAYLNHISRAKVCLPFFRGSFSRLALSLPSRPTPPHLFIFSLDRRGESVFWSPSNLRVTLGKKIYSWILLQVLPPLCVAFSSTVQIFRFLEWRVPSTRG